jgi:crotonobetainyl-CoA:carnitine CoA-transferase CaiB-like acyl-CoA transferase
MVSVLHPVLGTVRQIRSPLRVDGRLTELRMAPRRGEHTREVLVERCGYASADVDRLDAASWPPPSASTEAVTAFKVKTTA